MYCARYYIHVKLIGFSGTSYDKSVEYIELDI